MRLHLETITDVRLQFEAITDVRLQRRGLGFRKCNGNMLDFSLAHYGCETSVPDISYVRLRSSDFSERLKSHIRNSELRSLTSVIPKEGEVSHLPRW